MHYDYIIAGSGCAGLSLAYYMSQEPALQQKKILIIDKAKKTENDRTFSFWGDASSPFDGILANRWTKGKFFGTGEELTLDMTYRTLRGIDFYNFIYDTLEVLPNFHFHYEAIVEVDETATTAMVKTATQEFTADWVFNGIFDFKKIKKDIDQYYYQLQHFKGWVIKTPTPQFEKDTVHFMDFRTPQHNSPRFFYVLPFDENRALVEYTIFSAEMLTHEEYDKELKRYIKEELEIEEYVVEEVEFDKIIMTNQPFEKQQGKRIVRIGTMAGQVKASTGYAFTRIQRDTKSIALSMATYGTPKARHDTHFRFMLYDTMLLHIIANRGGLIERFFTKLFKKNKVQRVFDFLDEKTNFYWELRLFNTLPQLACYKAIFESLVLKPIKHKASSLF